MYIFKVHGNDYKVRFTYRQLTNEDVLDRVTESMTSDDEKTARDVFARVTLTTAELLLAGLQKYHADEFGYNTAEEKQAQIEKILDLFDDYEDESTEDTMQSAATLFSDLQDELAKNGFLSAILARAQEAEELAEAAETTKKDMEAKPVIERVRTTTSPTQNG